MKAARFIAAWSVAILSFLLRRSCRVRWHDDPRPSLHEEGCPYVYAILHCHQVAAIIGCEPGTGAMVSRSADGDLLVPSLYIHGIVPISRGEHQKAFTLTLFLVKAGYLRIFGIHEQPHNPSHLSHRSVHPAHGIDK